MGEGRSPRQGTIRVEETCFTTGMSEGLVRQYLELAQKLGISSDNLPSEEGPGHSPEDPTPAITVAWLTERLEADSIIEGERREAGGDIIGWNRPLGHGSHMAQLRLCANKPAPSIGGLPPEDSS